MWCDSIFRTQIVFSAARSEFFLEGEWREGGRRNIDSRALGFYGQTVGPSREVDKHVFCFIVQSQCT